jgi:hypothetical protein
VSVRILVESAVYVAEAGGDGRPLCLDCERLDLPMQVAS